MWQSSFGKLYWCQRYTLSLPAAYTVYRKISAPALLSPLSPLFSAGKFKNGQTQMCQIISLNKTASGQIQDGAKMFASVEGWKLPCIQYILSITIQTKLYRTNNCCQYLVMYGCWAIYCGIIKYDICCKCSSTFLWIAFRKVQVCE